MRGRGGRGGFRGGYNRGDRDSFDNKQNDQDGPNNTVYYGDGPATQSDHYNQQPLIPQQYYGGPQTTGTTTSSLMNSKVKVSPEQKEEDKLYKMLLQIPPERVDKLYEEVLNDPLMKDMDKASVENFAAYDIEKMTATERGETSLIHVYRITGEKFCT
jgi:hypothetical protein